LCKPFNISTLCSSVEVALDNFAKNISPRSGEMLKVRDGFFIKSGNIYKKVLLRDILYIKSDSVYNVIYTQNGSEHLSRGKIGEYAELFPEFMIQVHRSVVVNYKNISSICEGGVYVRNQFLPVSPSYRKKLMELFLTF